MEIYVKGFNKESDIIQEVNRRKKKRIFEEWKKNMNKMRRENLIRETENRELVQTFRRIILTSKVFIAIKKLRVIKGKKRIK